jgi:hypothetical protein
MKLANQDELDNGKRGLEWWKSEYAWRESERVRKKLCALLHITEGEFRKNWEKTFE